MPNAELATRIRQLGVEALVEFRRSRPKDIIDLSGAILPRLDLRGAPLAEADLRGAYLAESDLRDADFRMANLSGANLSATKLAGSQFFRTLASGVDFNKAEGVERIHFEGPCDLGISTVFSCDNPIVRQALIRGAGLPEKLTELLAALPYEPTQARAAFVVHMRSDGADARFFASRLEGAGIRTWLYPVDREGMKRPFRDILHQIRREDWVVFLASEDAMKNPLIDQHVEKIIQNRKLQPIAMDRYLSSEWEHAMRNDMMQLRIVRFYDCDTSEKREEAAQKLIAAIRRGLAEHL